MKNRRKSKRVHAPSRQNNTANRKATSRAEVSGKIRSLCKEWKLLDPVERGDQIRSLLNEGCSRRGLARELDQSENTIRRQLALAQLPEAERAALKAGASAKKILEKKADLDRRERTRARIALDLRTGELSDRLADLMIDFCRQYPVPLKATPWESGFNFLLRKIEACLNRLDRDGVPPLKLPRRLTPAQRIRRAKPAEDPGESWFAFHARWLAVLIRAEGVEREIQDRALAKAKARAGEIHVPELPIDSYWRGVARRADISRGPDPRKY